MDWFADDKPLEYTPQPVPLAELEPLLAERRAAALTRDAADIDVKKRNADILASLEQAGVTRHQATTGDIAQIIQQRPRRVIVADKLMKHGVPIDVIEACTEERPVKPFVKVQYAAAALPADDADASQTDTPPRPVQ
jgi:hypothetical protein